MAAPTEPTLGVTNAGDGAAVTATVIGTAGATHQLYYRTFAGLAWTAGNTRVGDGTIAQGGLTAETTYHFIVVSSNVDGSSPPSESVTVYVSAGTVRTYEIVAVIEPEQAGEVVELLCTEVDD